MLNDICDKKTKKQKSFKDLKPLIKQYQNAPTKTNVNLTSTKATLQTLSTESPVTSRQTKKTKESFYLLKTSSNNYDRAELINKIENTILNPMRKDYKKKEEENSELNAKQKELSKGVEMLKEQLNASKSNVLSLETESKLIMNEVNKVKLENEFITSEIEKIKKDNAESQNKMNKLKKEKIIYDNSYENAKNEIDDMKSEIKRLKNISELVSTQSKNMKSALFLLYKKIDMLKIQINNLTDAQDSQTNSLNYILTNFTTTQ